MTKNVATTLDQKIAELEKIVKRHLDLSKNCPATWNGVGCVLPPNHVPEEPHNFMIESPNLS